MNVPIEFRDRNRQNYVSEGERQIGRTHSSAAAMSA